MVAPNPSLDSWPVSEIRFDNSYIKIGGDSVDEYSEDDLKEMSKGDLISLVLEMQSANSKEENDEKKDSFTKESYYEGKVLLLQEELDALKSADTTDTSGRTDSRVREKNVRIQELENKLDSAESQVASLQRQVEEVRDRSRRLDADLAYEREAKAAAITKSRE